jgi:Uma2 family endonuclease
MHTESGRITNPPPKTVAARHYMRRAKKEQTVREQFLNLPEGTACQLIAGEIIMTPSPIPLHQLVIMELSFQMLQFVKSKDKGRVLAAPLDVSFNEENIFQPDILFIRKDNLSIIGEKMIEGVPDLVVEVLSPSSAYHDLRTKFRVYEQSGVQEYWIVDL